MQLNRTSDKSPLAAAIRCAMTRMGACVLTSTAAFSSWTTTRPNAACAPLLDGERNYLFIGSEAVEGPSAISYTLIYCQAQLRRILGLARRHARIHPRLQVVRCMI